MFEPLDALGDSERGGPAVLDEGEDLHDGRLGLRDAMQLCADELEEEAPGSCQGAGVWLRRVADVGERDGAVGCWGGRVGGKALRLEVELEVGEVGHGDA